MDVLFLFDAYTLLRPIPHRVPDRPSLQAATSSIIWGAGDLLAQRLEHDGGKWKVDRERIAITSSYGFFLVGPSGHMWYEFLDRAMTRLFTPATWRFIAAKIAADSVVFGPLHFSAYFAWSTLLRGGTLQETVAKIKSNFIATYLLECTVWPPIQAFNFVYVPVKHQLSVVNIGCVLDRFVEFWMVKRDTVSGGACVTPLTPPIAISLRTRCPAVVS